jgi:hypothetical protein
MADLALRPKPRENSLPLSPQSKAAVGYARMTVDRHSASSSLTCLAIPACDNQLGLGEEIGQRIWIQILHCDARQVETDVYQDRALTLV